jgi:hypothetical protein
LQEPGERQAAGGLRRGPGPAACRRLLLILLAACPGDPGQRPEEAFPRKLTVVVAEAAVYQRPDSLSRRLGSVRLGQEVLARERRRMGTPEGWEEIHAGPELEGFVRASALGTAEVLQKLRVLQASIEGVPPQALGVTSASTWLRLEPGRDGPGLEKLESGTRFEMFERRAILREPPAPAATPEPPTPSRRPGPTPTQAPPPRKEIWYKIRLQDGRVGYAYTGNLKFEPPQDIIEYTRFRRTVAWQKLRTIDAGAFGQVGEYLVAYATPGVDFGADFNRVELYTWDSGRYGTPYARGNMQGILPILVTRQGPDLYFEIRELDPRQPGKLVVRRYHFPHPIKEVSRTSVEADVGLH